MPGALGRIWGSYPILSDKRAPFTVSLVSFLRMCRILSVTLKEESERRHDGEAAADLQ